MEYSVKSRARLDRSSKARPVLSCTVQDVAVSTGNVHAPSCAFSLAQLQSSCTVRRHRSLCHPQSQSIINLRLGVNAMRMLGALSLPRSQIRAALTCGRQGACPVHQPPSAKAAHCWWSWVGVECRVSKADLTGCARAASHSATAGESVGEAGPAFMELCSKGEFVVGRSGGPSGPKTWRSC